MAAEGGGEGGGEALPTGLVTPPRHAVIAAIREVIRRQGGDQSNLIEVLHSIQPLEGFLSRQALYQVACELRLPLSQVYGVASFYHLFSRRPPPAQRCALCMGTACFVNGATRLRAVLEEAIATEPGTPPMAAGAAPADAKAPADAMAVAERNAWRLESSGCLGACGDAPVLQIDAGPAIRMPLDPPEGLATRLARLGLPLAAAQS